MTDLLELVDLQSAFTWFWTLATLAAIVAIPRWFGLNAFNALAYAQMTLAFNALTIIGGQQAEMVDAGRTVHFFLTEFGFLAITSLAYRQIIERRQRVMGALNAFFAGQGGGWLTAFMLMVGVFNFIIVPTGGESRIEYQTAAWFSALKPFIQIATPLAYLGAFVMLTMPRRRRVGMLLMLATIGGNVLTGSKASFMFNIVTAFLALRDLAAFDHWKLRHADRWKLAIVALPLAILALVRQDVTPASVADRFLLFGEATILTYFSETPTEACRDVSTFASMHRGIARLLGDASANDIDTLFGFALTKMNRGVNTFTGPNGRLSAYMICNFPGLKMILGWLVIGVYFALLAWLLRRTWKKPMHLALVYPYVVTSLGLASQDFNLIMADITLALLLLASTIPLTSKRRNYAFG